VLCCAVLCCAALVDFATSRKEHLKRHALKHSDKKPFKCTVPTCDYATKRKEHLQSHLMRKHNMGLPTA
jgi:uncharacterized Zn-finger protein